MGSDSMLRFALAETLRGQGYLVTSFTQLMRKIM